jgi:hypothetical protein
MVSEKILKVWKFTDRRQTPFDGNLYMYLTWPFWVSWSKKKSEVSTKRMTYILFCLINMYRSYMYTCTHIDRHIIFLSFFKYSSRIKSSCVKYTMNSNFHKLTKYICTNWNRKPEAQCCILILCNVNYYRSIFLKRSPLGQRETGLIRQVTSLKRSNSYMYEIFYDRARKMWPFNTGDCLIEVTMWTVLTVLVTKESQF